MSNLLILGAGQYGSVVYEIAESLHCYNKIDCGSAVAARAKVPSKTKVLANTLFSEL